MDNSYLLLAKMVVLLCKRITLQKKRTVIIMEYKNFLLDEEVDCLKKELYDLLENLPWAYSDILDISNQLDSLILKYYE